MAEGKIATGDVIVESWRRVPNMARVMGRW